MDRGLRSLGRDAAWSFATDASMLVATVASFLLLGSSLDTDGYGTYVGLYAIVAPIGGAAYSGTMLAVLHRSLREQDSLRSVTRSSLTLVVVTGVVGTLLAVIIARQILELGTLEMTFAGGRRAPRRGADVGCRLSDPGDARPAQIGSAADRHGCISNGSGLGALEHRPTDAAVDRDRPRGRLLHDGRHHGLLAAAAARCLGAAGSIERGLRTFSGRTRIPISAGLLHTDGDKAVLNAYGQSSTAGEYGAAFRFVSLALLPLRALDFAAFQRFLPHSEGARGEHWQRAVTYIKLSLALVTPLVIVLYLAAPALHHLVPGDADFSGSTPMIRWLLLFLPLLAVSTAPNNALLGLGRIGTRAFKLRFVGGDQHGALHLARTRDVLGRAPSWARSPGRPTSPSPVGSRCIATSDATTRHWTERLWLTGEPATAVALPPGAGPRSRRTDPGGRRRRDGARSAALAQRALQRNAGGHRATGQSTNPEFAA